MHFISIWQNLGVYQILYIKKHHKVGEIRQIQILIIQTFNFWHMLGTNLSKYLVTMQESAHFPHLIHFSLTHNLRSFRKTAPVGHTFIQIPQPVQWVNLINCFVTSLKRLMAFSFVSELTSIFPLEKNFTLPKFR